MLSLDEIKKQIDSNKMYLLYLTTADCNVCKVLKPKIQEICSDYPLVNADYIQIDDFPEIKGEFSVFSAPTIILFVGGKESLRYSRNIDLLDFEKSIERYSKLLEYDE